MASTPNRKRTRARASPSRRRVADLTTDELRELLDQLIEQKLIEFGGTPTRAPEKQVNGDMRRRASVVAGKFRSGRSDISEEHDRYLATSYIE